MKRYFNEKIHQQKSLFKCYNEIKNKIDLKIKLIKEMLSNLEKKVNKI